MIPLDDEALREILAGCEGVTPGPWSLQPIGRMAMAVIAANRIVIHSFDSAVELDGGQRTDKILSDARRQERDGFATLEADAAYIARLSPEVVRSLATQALEANRMREALAWYAEQVRNCRKITSDGSDARAALDRDGGELARAALHPEPSEGETNG